MLPEELCKFTEDYLANKVTNNSYTTVFIDEIRKWVNQIAEQMRDYQEYFGLNQKKFDTTLAEPSIFLEETLQISVISNLIKVSRMRLIHFLDLCLLKYHRASIEPGESLTRESHSKKDFSV